MRTAVIAEPGERFGRLVVVGFPTLERGQTKIPVRCDCGTFRTVFHTALQKGMTKSCGCLRREVTSARRKSHGMRHTRAYRVWADMLQRCSNPKRDNWKWYGGRGIKVCRRWLSFENFIADMGEPAPGMTIERKKVDRDYCKSNCLWIPAAKQAHNRANTVRVTHRGRERPLVEVCNMLGLKHKNVYQRIFTYGWSLDEALSLPPGRRINHKKGTSK